MNIIPRTFGGAFTNGDTPQVLFGTAVATVVVAKWEGELDQERFAWSLDNPEAIKLSS